MTTQSVIDRIRRQLNDDDPTGYHWPDDTLLKYLNDAQRVVFEKRPDLLLLGFNSLYAVADLAITVVSTVEGVLVESDGIMPETLEPFANALADYVCFRALLEESGDNEKAAQTFYQSAMLALGVG